MPTFTPFFRLLAAPFHFPDWLKILSALHYMKKPPIVEGFWFFIKEVPSGFEPL